MKHTLIFLALLGALIAFLNHQFPGALSSDGRNYHLIYLTVLLLVIGGGAALTNRRRWKQNLKYATWWVVIFLVIMVGHTYKDVLLDSKLASELIPGSTTIQGDGSITLNARADGHFYINARINGKKTRFLIDTGASDIMLTQKAADRIGLVIADGATKRIYSTASGTSSGLEVNIKQMHIGNMTLQNATAYVNQGNSSTNLLGQSFMNRLSSYSVENGRMTLVP